MIKRQRTYQFIPTHATVNSADGFKDGNTHPNLNDYEYDDNDFRVKKIENLFCEESERSSMILDRNKGITEIKYNHLNLPTKITWSNNKYISYQYNAAGQKIKKTVEQNDSLKIVDYLDGFQYAGSQLQFFPTAEGYVKATPTDRTKTNYHFNYIYNYTDHLGNVRLSYTLDPQAGTLQIVDENHYYPFGLRHETHYPSGNKKDFRTNIGDVGFEPVNLVLVTSTEYNYKYNGFEYQDELDLNWYDYQARNYDPAIGRWMNIDPLAEISRRHSPYTYVYNNPLRYIDSDGMKADDVVLGGTMKQEAFNQLQSAVNSELTLSMNDAGKLSYTQNDPSSTLSADAQQLVNAIDDNSIFITVTAENTFQTSEGGLLIGGAFMGNEVVQHENLNAVFANQEINPTTLATIDGENGTPGSLVLHEVTEAYQGALITQQSGESVGPATNADVNNPQSVYSRAHNSATPQSMIINENVYDARGNLIPNYQPGQGGARLEYTTQNGTVLYSYP